MAVKEGIASCTWTLTVASITVHETATQWLYARLKALDVEGSPIELRSLQDSGICSEKGKYVSIICMVETWPAAAGRERE